MDGGREKADALVGEFRGGMYQYSCSLDLTVNFRLVAEGQNTAYQHRSNTYVDYIDQWQTFPKAVQGRYCSPIRIQRYPAGPNHVSLLYCK